MLITIEFGSVSSAHNRRRQLHRPAFLPRIAKDTGDSRQNQDEMAGDGDDLPQILSRIRPGSS